mgnify:CR=1 FL=1
MQAATAPERRIPCQYKPSNKTGKNVAAARENAQVTQYKMLTGRLVAIQAAAKATTINKILDSMTWRSGGESGATVWKYMSWAKAFEIVSNNPYAMISVTPKIK